MAVHPVSNTSRVIPRTAIIAVSLAFTLITLSHYTSSGFAWQDHEG
jgi:hypothetical protein